jgi:hypothetical protein
MPLCGTLLVGGRKPSWMERDMGERVMEIIVDEERGYGFKTETYAAGLPAKSLTELHAMNDSLERHLAGFAKINRVVVKAQLRCVEAELARRKRKGAKTK